MVNQSQPQALGTSGNPNPGLQILHGEHQVQLCFGRQTLPEVIPIEVIFGEATCENSSDSMPRPARTRDLTPVEPNLRQTEANSEQKNLCCNILKSECRSPLRWLLGSASLQRKLPAINLIFTFPSLFEGTCSTAQLNRSLKLFLSPDSHARTLSILNDLTCLSSGTSLKLEPSRSCHPCEPPPRFSC